MPSAQLLAQQQQCRQMGPSTCNFAHGLPLAPSKTFGSPKFLALQRASRTLPLPCVSSRSQHIVEAFLNNQQHQERVNSSSQASTSNSFFCTEESRKDFRSVFDFEAWQKHRSPFRFFTRLLLFSHSRILINIWPVVAWVTLIATAVASYSTALAHGLLPHWLPGCPVHTACSAFIQHTSVALSLLLVFRTNTSYGRWDEARKMWGGLLNRSRDLMRMAASSFPKNSQPAKQAVGRWLVGFAHALRLHLQPEATITGALRLHMRPEELRLLEQASHPPLMACQVLSEIIEQAPVSMVHQGQMHANVTFFEDVIGGCERLLRAPIPIAYTRHTARFLMLWLTLLPFALFPTCGWFTIPVAAGAAGVLCAIEEIGVQCEEPFGILPLDMICARVEDSVQATLLQDSNAKTVVANLFEQPPAERKNPFYSRAEQSEDPHPQSILDHNGNQILILPAYQ